MMILNMTPEQATRLAESAQNLGVILSYAEEAFKLLGRLHGDHDHDGHHGFEAISVLCGRALASVCEKEGNDIDTLVDLLGKATVRKEQEA